MMKKINAVLALLMALLLAAHNTVNGIMMMKGTVDASPAWLAYVLIGLFFVHALVSLVFILFKHDGKGIAYKKLSKSCLIQRISAILLIPLVLFHGFVRLGEFGTGIAEILIAHFFIMLLAYIHIPLSVPNALVTLGIITTTKKHAVVRIIVGICCAALFLFGLAASFVEVMAL